MTVICGFWATLESFADLDLDSLALSSSGGGVVRDMDSAAIGLEAILGSVT